MAGHKTGKLGGTPMGKVNHKLSETVFVLIVQLQNELVMLL